MSTNLKLPAIIPVDDYLEFAYLEEKMRILIPDLKIREVGYGPAPRHHPSYLGVAYIGNMKSPSNKAGSQKIRFWT